MTVQRRMVLALVLGVSLAAAGIAQQSDDADTPETEAASGAEATTAVPDAPTADEILEAENAAVDEVLSDAELVYEEDEDSEDFIPSEQVSADQSLDYPIDI